MSVDDLINKALKGSGGILDTSNMFGVIGDVQTQELFIMNLQEFFTENLYCFSKGESTAALLVGVYTTEQQARACIESIRDQQQQSPGLLAGPNWHILMGNPGENRLFALPLNEYYVGYLAFYRYKVNAGNLSFGIFDSAEAADNAIDLIRYSIREED
ncbi:hypothetical protein [Niabella aquatica]